MNPLDAFVRDSIKNKLNELHIEQRNAPTKLQAALMKTVGGQMADANWIKKVKRARDRAPKRLRWIKEDDGATIFGKPRKREV